MKQNTSTIAKIVTAYFTNYLTRQFLEYYTGPQSDMHIDVISVDNNTQLGKIDTVKTAELKELAALNKKRQELIDAILTKS